MFTPIVVFIINVNVLFLSNSQLTSCCLQAHRGVSAILLINRLNNLYIKELNRCIQNKNEVFSIAKIRQLFEMASNKKKATKEYRPLDSFHNGIILIVNYLKSNAKIQLFYESPKIIYNSLISCIELRENKVTIGQYYFSNPTIFRTIL